VTTADLAALKVAAAHAAQTVVVLEREFAEARERHAAARRLLEDGVVRWLAAPVDVPSDDVPPVDVPSDDAPAGSCPATLDGERCVCLAGHVGDHMAGGRQWVIELLQGPGLRGDRAQAPQSNHSESPNSSAIASIPSIPGLNLDAIATTTTAAPTPAEMLEQRLADPELPIVAPDCCGDDDDPPETDAIILCGAGGCFRRVPAEGDRCEDHPAKARPPKLCEVPSCGLPGASAPNSTGAWCPEHSKLPGEERRAIRAKSKELKREARLEKARAKKAAEMPKDAEAAP
jgi:hypothetical protein